MLKLNWVEFSCNTQLPYRAHKLSATIRHYNDLQANILAVQYYRAKRSSNSYNSKLDVFYAKMIVTQLKKKNYSMRLRLLSLHNSTSKDAMYVSVINRNKTATDTVGYMLALLPAHTTSMTTVDWNIW